MHVHKYMYVYRHTRVSLSLCVCARHQRFGGGKRQEGGGRRRVMPSSVCIVQVVQEKFNATVIYGDTDSVMVNFHCGEGPDAVKKALELGTQAAQLVTKQFKEPNELEFEKVYMPYILYSKKRYAGQMYTNPDKPDKIDIKGLQVWGERERQRQRQCKVKSE